MNKNKLIFFLIAIVCLLLVGCGEKNTENNIENNTENKPIESTSLPNNTTNESIAIFRIEEGVLKGFYDESKINDGYELKIDKFMEGQEINYIEKGAFKGNDKIVSVTINGKVGMFSNTFSECKNLKKVSILTKGAYLGEGSFKDCVNLETVELAMEKTGFHNTKTIPHWSFENCTALKSVVINGELERIQQEAFKNCVNLESINLPGCEYIGADAFYNCKKLNIELPEDIEIGDNAFGSDNNTFIFEKSSEVSIKEITNTIVNTISPYIAIFINFFDLPI